MDAPMNHFSLAVVFAVSVAMPALADQKVTMELALASPPFSATCSIILREGTGKMSQSRLINRGGGISEAFGSFADTEEKLALFRAAASALQNGANTGADPTPTPTPPYVRLTYGEGEKAEFRTLHEVLIPGTDVPAEVLPLFEALANGICLGR